MALKDLLVHVDQTEQAPLRLSLAADLARRHGSYLTVLYTREWNRAELEGRDTAELGLVSAKALERLEDRVEASINASERRLQAVLSQLQLQSGLDAEWRTLRGFPSDIVPQHARYTDLCILGQQDAGPSASVDYTFPEHVLFESGRPVVFVPSGGTFATLGRHIAVGWNSSRAAARAVNDALSLMEHAERTTVLAINEADFIGRYGALPLEQMATHLKRHNASVDVLRLDQLPERSIADTLQAEALRCGADVLVAGAFGHAKLREKILGGVTRDLLERMRLPLFMSH